MSNNAASANATSAKLSTGQTAICQAVICQHVSRPQQRPIIHFESHPSVEFQEVLIRLSHHRSDYNLN